MIPSKNAKNESPSWKNPREIFKRHLKRKTSSRRLLSEVASSPSLLQSEACTQSQPALRIAPSRNANRLRNPFKRRSLAVFKTISESTKENDRPELSWDSEETLHGFTSPSIFKRIDEENDSSKRTKTSFYDNNLSDIYPTDFSSLTDLYSSTPKSALLKLEDVEKTRTAHLPNDLRLGVKLRMESKNPFPWMNNPHVPGKCQIRISGLEYDAAIRMFCGDESNPLKTEIAARSNGYTSCVSEKSSPLVHLQKATMYWQYPNIAWMRMFPRLDGSQKLISGGRDPQVPCLHTLGSALADAIVEQWIQAFEQLFHSWKKGSRHSFYLCCSLFTALFLKTHRETPIEIDDDSTCTSWRIGGDCFQVIITPTTLGFREQLRNEGISYTMRSQSSTNKRSSKENGSTSVQYINENTNSFDRSESLQAFVISDKRNGEKKPIDFGDLNEGVNEEGSPNKLNGFDESDNVAWLKEIGISPASTRRLTKHLSMSSISNRSGGSSDEGRSLSGSTLFGDDGGKSTIIVSEPSSIQAFFNLINTSKIFRPITGPHAGLPPTLLSAQPFLHSALCCLNKSSQIVKKGNEMVYVCELDNGPIMPHMFSAICDFISSCPGVNSVDNNVTVYVVGRTSCQGINQAIPLEGFVDLNEFVYRPDEMIFYY